jgi:hypothetical protein
MGTKSPHVRLRDFSGSLVLHVYDMLLALSSEAVLEGCGEYISYNDSSPDELHERGHGRYNHSYNSILLTHARGAERR